EGGRGPGSWAGADRPERAVEAVHQERAGNRAQRRTDRTPRACEASGRGGSGVPECAEKGPVENVDLRRRGRGDDRRATRSGRHVRTADRQETTAPPGRCRRNRAVAVCER